MAEKNTQDNQKNKKKHRWIGIILISLLLLFIGLAGYYLERDLEPVPDNQIEDSEVMEERQDSTEEEMADNGEETEVTEETQQEITEEDTETEVTEEIQQEVTEEDTPTEEDTETEISEEDTELQEIEDDGMAEETEDTEQAKDREEKADTEEPLEPETTEKTEEEITPQDTDKKSEQTVSEQDTDETEETDEREDRDKDVTEVEEKTDVETEIQEERDSAAEEDIETVPDEEGEEPVSEKTSEQREEETEISPQEEEMDSQTDEPDQQDQITESEQPIIEQETEEIEDTQATEESRESEEDYPQEIEDPSLLDRILSVLGLSESDFTQNLNILFVGLDDEESVAVGTIEADSIMLSKLRPEENMLQIEHIEEDRMYKGQSLREYHNGDIHIAVEDITNSKVDYYVYVKYQGFEKVIDELGGVTINLNEEVVVPGLGLKLKAGDNLLSGKEALNFVRWSDSDSFARFERQKLLIKSIIAKLKGNNILFNVKDLYNTIVESYNSVETDINPVLAAEIFKYIKDNDDLELEFIN